MAINILFKDTEFTQEEIEKYTQKGVRLGYTYSKTKPKPFKNDSIGFIINKLYLNIAKDISYYLHTKHKVIVRYKDKDYRFYTPDDWSRTFQDPKDQLKTITISCELKQLFDEAYKEYKEAQIKKQKYWEYRRIADTFTDMPEISEIDRVLNAYSYLYDITYDPESLTEKLNAYTQIKYYLDNDIPYCNERPLDMQDEPMFEIIYIGNSNLFEDLIYKGQQNTQKINEILHNSVDLELQ